MAHQTDFHIVKQKFEPEHPGEKVTDPVCGMELERGSAKHVLFRGEQAIYFCSRDCQQRFLNPAHGRTSSQTREAS